MLKEKNKQQEENSLVDALRTMGQLVGDDIFITLIVKQDGSINFTNAVKKEYAGMVGLDDDGDDADLIKSNKDLIQQIKKFLIRKDLKNPMEKGNHLRHPKYLG